jgi:uncharacterized protein with von Willebrand factor type A (vWA) domain
MTEEKELKGRERSIANLTAPRFKPGQSGNPSGRPKNVLSKALRKKLDELESDAPDARSNADRIADKLVSLALDGNLEAIKVVLDRMEGRPRQTVSLTLDQREEYERMVDNLIESEAMEGRELSREQAIAALASVKPEIEDLLS